MDMLVASFFMLVFSTISLASPMSFIGRAEITDHGLENILHQLQDSYLLKTVQQVEGMALDPSAIVLGPQMSECSDEDINIMSRAQAWTDCIGVPRFVFAKRLGCNLEQFKPRAVQFQATRAVIKKLKVNPHAIQCRGFACEMRVDLEDLCLLVDGILQDVDKNTVFAMKKLVFSLISSDDKIAHIDLKIQFDPQNPDFTKKFAISDLQVVIPEHVAGIGLRHGHVLSMTGLKPLEKLQSALRANFPWPNVFALDSYGEYWRIIWSFWTARKAIKSYFAAGVLNDEHVEETSVPKELIMPLITLLNDLILTNPNWVSDIGAKISAAALNIAQLRLQEAMKDIDIPNGKPVQVPLIKVQDVYDSKIRAASLAKLSAKILVFENRSYPNEGEALGWFASGSWESALEHLLEKAWKIVLGMRDSHSVGDFVHLQELLQLVDRIRDLADKRISAEWINNNPFYRLLTAQEGELSIAELKKIIQERNDKLYLEALVSLNHDDGKANQPVKVQIAGKFSEEELRRLAIPDPEPKTLSEPYDLGILISYDAVNEYLRQMHANENNLFEANCSKQSLTFKVLQAPQVSLNRDGDALQLTVPQIKYSKGKFDTIFPNANQNLVFEFKVAKTERGSIKFEPYFRENEMNKAKSFGQFVRSHFDPRMYLSRTFDLVINLMIKRMLEDDDKKNATEVDGQMLEGLDEYGVKISRARIVDIALHPNAMKVYLALSPKGATRLANAAMGQHLLRFQSALKIKKWILRARDRIKKRKELSVSAHSTD